MPPLILTHVMFLFMGTGVTTAEFSSFSACLQAAENIKFVAEKTGVKPTILCLSKQTGNM